MHEIHVTRNLLGSLIECVPRVSLAFKPTPLEELTNLSKRLGDPRILAKRDDLMGMALGGNKVRYLEFRMREALDKNAVGRILV
ncbi:MAG: hypothetical protein ACJ0A8_01545 [Dehalococcoidia bacterium]